MARCHEAMKHPVELYRPSPRRYSGLSELTYPFHDRTITVTSAPRPRQLARGCNDRTFLNR